MSTTTVRLSAAFLRKASAPGGLIARVRGAEKLGVTTAEVSSRITAQETNAKWIEWTVTRIEA